MSHDQISADLQTENRRLLALNDELVKLVEYCLWVEDWDADWVCGELERIIPGYAAPNPSPN